MQDIDRENKNVVKHRQMKKYVFKVLLLLFAYYCGCFFGAFLGTFFFDGVTLFDNIVGVMAMAPFIHIMTIFVCANKVYFGFILTIVYFVLAVMTIREYFKTDHILFLWAFVFLILLLSLPSLAIYQRMNELQPF
ncbi:MAG: hypothetical protein K8S27_08315 [Candidatus Omnitrophica bacterium]|nr:hypothetical protein [Candidatus Omnitrophota bacterium]